MRAGEAHPPDALHVADGAEQVGEERTATGEVPSVGVDVLTEERHLGHPPVGQRGHLADELLEGPRDLPPRTDGTMQKAQELSQPVWMVTHAA